MKKNRAILMLVAIAIGIVLGAVFLRGEPERPDSKDLPPIAIESE